MQYLVKKLLKESFLESVVHSLQEPAKPSNNNPVAGLFILDKSSLHIIARDLDVKDHSCKS